MNIKLIITDIDGTLIGESLKVDDRTKKAIRVAQQRGISVVAATGRMLPSAMEYVDELGIQGPLICYNGALIINTATGEVIYEKPVPLELAKKVLSFAESEGIYAQYYDKRAYYMREHCAESEDYFRHTGVKGTAIGGSLAEGLADEPLKVLMISDLINRIDMLCESAQVKFGDRLEIVKSMPNYLDFTHREANKGIAAKILAEYMGLAMDNVMAIGDGLNDISMLRQAGLGVAVGNAPDSVKKAAGYVTANQEDFGAAKAIEELILKEN